jgi:hypothetical protein
MNDRALRHLTGLSLHCSVVALLVGCGGKPDEATKGIAQLGQASMNAVLADAALTDASTAAFPSRCRNDSVHR